MFRRLGSSIPSDFQPPNNLEQLGFTIDTNDQVRLIEAPEQKYQYRINRNDRVNEVYKKAFNSCLRSTISERLANLGLKTVRLPIGARADEKHVPIYVSHGIEQKQRVLVIFGERNQDLGVFSYRSVREDGIKLGSAQELVEATVNGRAPNHTFDTPGIIITNPGQLIWYRNGQRAIGYHEYLGVQRPTATHGPFRIDPVKNVVAGNANFTEHVQYIFENVMLGFVHPDAKFDVVGLEYTGDAVVQYLAQNWDIWQNRISGVCLGNPQFKLKELALDSDNNANFSSFLAKRVRAYFVSDAPLETPIPGRSECGCNCYASGEELYEDDILIKSWRSMMDWFNMINTLEDYEEPVFTMLEGTDTAASTD